MAGVTVSGGLCSYPYCVILAVIKGLCGDALPMHPASTLNSPHVPACHLSLTVANSAESCIPFLAEQGEETSITLASLGGILLPRHTVFSCFFSPCALSPSVLPLRSACACFTPTTVNPEPAPIVRESLRCKKKSSAIIIT